LSRWAAKKLAGKIGDFFDGALDRRAVYVHVEDRHENADFFARPVIERRLFHDLGNDHLAVGRRNDSARLGGNHAVRIPEKEADAQGRPKTQEGRQDKFQQGKDRGNESPGENYGHARLGNRKGHLPRGVGPAVVIHGEASCQRKLRKATNRLKKKRAARVASWWKISE
jgi:hypothetical protein